METINIAKDFATETGARTYDDGPRSGQEFFEIMLRPKFKEVFDKGEKLMIILDGTEGMATSFINEAFRRLGAEFGPDRVWTNLILISNEIPKYIDKVREAIYEGAK